MRKVIVSNLVSLDGYLAGPDGDLSWFAVGPDFFGYVHEMLPHAGGFLFGRVTYEMMSAYWTSVDAEKNDAFVARYMNELPKWVASRTLKKVGWGRWGNASLAADPVATVRSLKAEGGGNLMIFGSGGLVSSLAPAGLIDEYRLIVNPTALGRGIPMFQGLTARLPLKLAASRVLDGNTVMTTYHPETA